MSSDSLPAARRLTRPQRRALAALAGADQFTFGRHRARVQNTLVALGLARFLDVDGIGVCRITTAGRHVATMAIAARPPPPPPETAPVEEEGDTDEDLRRRLRSLRTQKNAVEYELYQVDCRIKETETALRRITRPKGRA